MFVVGFHSAQFLLKDFFVLFHFLDQVPVIVLSALVNLQFSLDLVDSHQSYFLDLFRLFLSLNVLATLILQSFHRLLLLLLLMLKNQLLLRKLIQLLLGFVSSLK